MWCTASATACCSGGRKKNNAKKRRPGPSLFYRAVPGRQKACGDALFIPCAQIRFHFTPTEPEALGADRGPHSDKPPWAYCGRRRRCIHQVFHQHLDAGKHRARPGTCPGRRRSRRPPEWHHHPEAGDTRGVAQDLRTQDVAVKLLEGDNENHEKQALFGADPAGSGRRWAPRP